MPAERPARLSQRLAALGAELDDAVESLPLPAWLVGSNGTVLWQNRAARGLAGDRRVSHFIDGVAPESRHRALTLFSRTLLGVDGASEAPLVVTRGDGERVLIEAGNVAVRADGKVVAIFGVGRVVPQARAPEEISLAPRLHETLRLLAEGNSTDAIAAALGVARSTTRNYVRQLLKALGVHSRVEAVARGRELGLL